MHLAQARPIARLASQTTISITDNASLHVRQDTMYLLEAVWRAQQEHMLPLVPALLVPVKLDRCP